MVTSMRSKVYRRLATLGAGMFLSAAWAAGTCAQGSAAGPTISGAGDTEYCAFGDLLALNGAHFGLQAGRGYVTIGVPIRNAAGSFSYQDFPLSIKDWSDTQIHARLFMPGGADPDVGEWVATVHRADGQLASLAFTVASCGPRAEDQSSSTNHQPLPLIHGLQMTQFHSGDRIIFSGEHFGGQPQGGYVSLVGAFQDGAGTRSYREYPVTLEGWSSFRIQVPFFMPTGGVPGTWVATVHRGDGETASTAFMVVPLPPPTPVTPPPGTGNCLGAGAPVIEDFQKTQFCAGGDFLVIHGTNFCNDPDGGWVTITAPFKDAEGNISYQDYRPSVIGWLSTQIHVQFVAPAGAVPGTYTATVHANRYDGAGHQVVKTASGSFNVVSCSPR